MIFEKLWFNDCKYNRLLDKMAKRNLCRDYIVCAYYIKSYSNQYQLYFTQFHIELEETDFKIKFD